MNNKVIPLRTGDRTTTQAIKADRTLTRRAAGGAGEAFRQLVDTNKQQMFTLAKSVIKNAGLAEDIVQDAFIKAYRTLPDFRGDCRRSTWRYRIIYLTASAHRRRESRHLELVEDNYLTHTVTDNSPFARSDGAVDWGSLCTGCNRPPRSGSYCDRKLPQ